MDQEAMNGQRTQGMEFQATKALHMAARAGHADLCRLLLNHRRSESTDTDGTICMFAFWARPKRWTYLNVIIEMCWYFAATPEAESEIKFELSTGKKCLIEIVSCYSSIHYSIFKPAARVFLAMECYGFAYLSLDRASLHFPMFPMVQLLRALYIRKRGGLRWPNSSAPCCSCRAWRRRSAQGDAWTFLGF